MKLTIRKTYNINSLLQKIRIGKAFMQDLLKKCLLLIVVVGTFTGCGFSDTTFFKKNLDGFSVTPLREKICNIKERNREIVVGFKNRTVNKNPFFDVTKADYFIKRAIHATIVYIDHTDGSIKCQVAKSYEQIKDTNTYKFYIRPDAVFSDGTPLTKEDVKSSLDLMNTIFKDRYPYDKYLSFDNKMSIDTTNDDTVIVRLNNADPDFLHKISEYPILSRFDIEKIGDFDHFYNRKNFKNAGVYNFSGAENGAIELKRNANYNMGNDKSDIINGTESIKCVFYSKEKDMVTDYLGGLIDIFEAEDLPPIKELFDNKNAGFQIINAGGGVSKIITAFNCFNEGSVEFIKNVNNRKKISDIISSAGGEYCYTGGSIADYGQYTHYKSGTSFSGGEHTIRIIRVNYDNATVRVSDKAALLLKEAGLQCEIVSVDNSDFITKVFYDKEYDIAFFPYTIYPYNETVNYLYSDDFPGFSPFFEDDSIMNIDKTNVAGISEVFRDKCQFSPVFIKYTYFPCKTGLVNFYYNANYGKWPDLRTIQSIQLAPTK